MKNYLKKLTPLICLCLLFSQVLICISGCESHSSDFEPYDENATHSDSVLPQVISTVPANDSSDVPVNIDISITFNKPLDTSNITTNIFKITDDIKVELSHTDTHFILKSSAPLNYSTPYSFTIPKEAVIDQFGNMMAADYVFSFITENPPDTTPPEIQSTNPQNGATNVSVDSDVTIMFSELIDTSGVTSASFILPDGITFTLTDTSITFFSSNPLEYDTTYSFIIQKEYIRDLFGNTMTKDYEYVFSTEPHPDMIPPYVLSTTPSDGTINVPLNTNIRIEFSEPMDTSGITKDTFTLPNGIDIYMTYTATSVTFSPRSLLEYNTEYSFTIPKEVKDVAGNQMGENYTFSFSTIQEPVNKIIDMVYGKNPNFIYAIDEKNLLNIINLTTQKIDYKFDLPSRLSSAGKPLAMSYSHTNNKIYIIRKSSNNIEIFDIDSMEFEEWPIAVVVIPPHSISEITDIKVDSVKQRIFILTYRNSLSKPYIYIIEMDNKNILTNVLYSMPLDELSDDNIEPSIDIDNNQNVYLSWIDDTKFYIRKYSVSQQNDDIYLVENNRADFESCSDTTAVSPDGTHIALSCGNLVYDLNSNFEISGEWNVETNINELKFDTDGFNLYGIDSENYLNVMNTSSYDPIIMMEFPNSGYYSVFSTNSAGTMVLGFSYNSNINNEYKLYFFSDLSE